MEKDKVTYIFAYHYFGEFSLLPLCPLRLCGSLKKNKTTEALRTQRNKRAKL
jgi:hypothetical protein